MQLLKDCITHREGFIPDRYQVTETLAEGLNSNVYCAKDRTTGQSVILKCFSQRVRGAYLREMAASFGLRHSNVIRCTDTFYLGGGKKCIVYEYVSGGDMAVHIAKHGPLDRNHVFRCLHDLLNALVYVHGRGLIHCDIKPENILVMTRAGGDLQFVLSDLGAACVASEALKGTHTICSLAYVAPERLYDRFSFNSDLYSLGVLAYELLTGHLPFYGSPAEIESAHISRTPSFSEIDHSHFRDLVMRLLEKDPRRRVCSAQEALCRLEQVHRGPTALDRPPSLSNAIDVSITQRMICQEALSHWACYTVENDKAPQNLLILHDDGEPLVGLEYENYVHFWRYGYTPSLPILEKSCSAQILNSRQLAYALRSSIFRFDVGTGKRTCIHDKCSQLVSFHLNKDCLLWFDAGRGHVCNLKGDTKSIYRSVSYVFQQKACWFSHNLFVSTEGPTNEEVVLRDKEANVLFSWKLGGPVLALIFSGKAVLAMSLSIDSAPQLTAWRIVPDEDPARLDLPAKVTAWCYTPGHMFWVVERRYFQGCGIDLCARQIGELPLAVERFHVSSDHRFFATLSTGESGKLLVNIWENCNSRPTGSVEYLEA